MRHGAFGWPEEGRRSEACRRASIAALEAWPYIASLLAFVVMVASAFTGR